MRICVYAESIKVFTTGTPQRGMMKHLIAMNQDDEFIFFVRKEKTSNKVLDVFFEEIACFKNVRIENSCLSTVQTNLLFLMGLYRFASIPVNADVYISCDIVCFGSKNVPIVNLIADFSSINKGEVSSLNYVGKMLRRLQYKLMVKHSSHIVAISQFTLSILNDKNPETISKSSLVYNGIEDSWFTHPIKPCEIAVPSQYFIWWGHISKRKNVDGLLEAYKQFLLENTKVDNPPCILIVSNNHEETKHGVECDSVLRHKVIFVKSVGLDQLISLVDNSRGVLFPSYYEGFGLPVIESFSRGRQVLTSDVSALKEVTCGKAIYCDPHDIQTIKHGIAGLCDPVSDEQCDDLKRIAARYSYLNAAKSFNQIIKHRLTT